MGINMINLIHEKYKYNSGISSYGNLIAKGLKEYNINYNDVAIPKIEINILNKKIGGWFSKSIFSKIMASNENVNHSLDHWSINKFTNLITVHDIIPFIYSEDYKLSNIAINYYLKTFEKINKINNIIVPSYRVLKTLNQVELLDLSNKVINIIPRGVNNVSHNNYNPYENDGKLHLITIGDFNFRKRFDLLYDYVKDLNDVKLYHIGKISDYNSYIKAMKNINSNVKYLGYINDNKLLYSYIYFADKFVYNSLDEGQGMPSLEAMKLGIQPIINNNEIHNEMVGNLGFYYDTKEEFINLIYKQSNSRFSLVNYISKYDNWIEKIINVYEKMENN